MSTLPDFTGPGFFAGEAPDGLTTVAGTPTSAQVRVYWRDPADPQAPDVLVASTQSAADGTWQIAGLNPALRYVVRAQKSQFDDVTVVGAMPSRSDVIAYVDQLVPHEDEFGNVDGLAGYVLLDSGLRPFTCEVIQPLPYGLSARVEGRKLLIEGVSSDIGLWEGVVRVTASNGALVDVPVQVRVQVPWTPARLAVPAKIWLDDDSPIAVDDTDGCSQWGDKSGQDNHFVQSSAGHRPVIVSGELHSRRVVRFDGTRSFMQAASEKAKLLMSGAAAGWVFAVVRKRSKDTVAGDRPVFWIPRGSSMASRFALAYSGGSTMNRPYIGGRRLDSDGFGSASLALAPDSVTDWKLLFGQIDYAQRRADIEVDFEHATAQNLWSGGGVTSSSPSYYPPSIGAFSGASVTAADVDMACIFFGDGVLDPADRLRLEGWSAHRYGLVDKLPADHPYKESAP
ncbi:hypothetical protein J1777_05895 [Comamonas denitrificans]|uniref:Uncharacterized protein n=1 Tax=Comamonas denitrificans TaxID=117506 RepID=A0A939GZX2_9BURK|nr:hypothetical protein [Comamonas denitrificans]MBO1249370.1 hypothetical protein [Comamonas denitrificans]